MRKVLIHISLLTLLAACGARTRQNPTNPSQPLEPKTYGYTIKKSYPHATDSYTQGLLFDEGILWEGTGQNGASRLLKHNLESGTTERVAHLGRSEFGEGIAILGEELFQLTWMNNTAYIYDRKSGKQTRTLRYPGEGWGLTSDGKSLYLSDGSATIRRLNPTTFAREGAIVVTLRGEPLEYINELEWVNDRIWANVYMTDYIVQINPRTGVVEGLINLEGLLPEKERTPHTDVLNGIAYDPASDRIFVTGKNWSKLYEIELIEQ